MKDLAFITIIFLALMGPARLMRIFTQITRTESAAFRRRVAVEGTLVAVVVCVVIVLFGERLISHYRLSMQALQLSAGLVLLLTGLKEISGLRTQESPKTAKLDHWRFAMSPLATPTLVSPIAVAAILIFVMLAKQHAGVLEAVWVSLAIVLTLDFLIMYFYDQITRFMGVVLVFELFDTVLIILQIALAVQVMLRGVASVNVFSPG